MKDTVRVLEMLLTLLQDYEHNYENQTGEYTISPAKLKILGGYIMSDLFIKDTTSILNMLSKEIPLQIEMSALLVASNPNENEKCSNLEKAIAHFEKKLKENPEDTQVEATIKRLRKEVEEGIFKTDESEISYDEDSLRRRLYIIFGAYLAFLEEKDTEGFNMAMKMIEENISDSRNILSRVQKSLGIKDKKSKSTPIEDKASAIRPKNLFATMDKFSKTFFDIRKNALFYEEPEVLLRVGKKGGNPVHEIVSVNINDLKNYTLSSNVMVNPYNRSLHNVAVSLYVAGNTHITPRMIYETMNGGKRIHKPPKQIYKAIMESMRKMMHTAIKIDNSEEAKAYGIQEFKFEGYLLPVTLTTAIINGQTVECFKFLAEPPLYTLAKGKKQISQCDIKLLAANLSMTPENIVIRDYLLEQILTIQNPKANRSNTILYDTMYDYLGIDARNEATLRAKKRDIRDKVKSIIDAWVKENFIKGYDEVLEGRKIVGLYIKVRQKT